MPVCGYEFIETRMTRLIKLYTETPEHCPVDWKMEYHMYISKFVSQNDCCGARNI